ncbi:hypothetical protein [Streptosporangium roseum]|uniref:hypothetical protein n=1 Tax=Streptosporangium roseum TaxID=2001 RepID=UPI003332C8EB
MNIIASTVSLVVDDVDASSRFFTTHLGFREAMNAEGFVSHSRGTSTTGPLRQGKRPPHGSSRDTGKTGHQSIMFVISEVNRSVSATLGRGISEVRHGVDFRDWLISEVRLAPAVAPR